MKKETLGERKWQFEIYVTDYRGKRSQILGFILFIASHKTGDDSKNRCSLFCEIWGNLVISPH